MRSRCRGHDPERLLLVDQGVCECSLGDQVKLLSEEDIDFFFRGEVDAHMHRIFNIYDAVICSFLHDCNTKSFRIRHEVLGESIAHTPKTFELHKWSGVWERARIRRHKSEEESENHQTRKKRLFHIVLIGWCFLPNSIVYARQCAATS